MTSSPEFAVVRPHVAAGVLFLDETERVLLVVPSYKDYLDLPGGYVEPGESPSEAAAREIREEIAAHMPVGRLLVADWWHVSADRGAREKVLFVFDGGRMGPAEIDGISVDGDEVVGYRFVPPSDLAAVTIPRLANRIEHAVAARRDGTTRYLEDGQLRR